MAGFLDFNTMPSPMLEAMRTGGVETPETNRDVGALDITGQQQPQEQQQYQQQDPYQGYQQPPQMQQPPQSMGQGLQAFLRAPGNSQGLLAFASGMGKGETPLAGLGGAFGAVNDQINLDQKRQQEHEQAMATFQQKRDTLDETKRLNSGKIAGYAAKAAKDGMPKKIGGAGGQTTLLWPDSSITSHADEEVQQIYDTAQSAKAANATIIANGGAATKMLADPKTVEEYAKLEANFSGAANGFKDFQETKKMFEDTGGVSTFSRVVPGMPWVNKVLGTEDGVMHQKLAKLNMAGFLSYVKGMPGALSDKEGSRIEKAIPTPDAGPEIWAEFFKNDGPILEGAMKRAEATLNQRKANMAQVQSQASANNAGTLPTSPTMAPAKTVQDYPAPKSKALNYVQGGTDVRKPSEMSQETLDVLRKTDPEAFAKMMGQGAPSAPKTADNSGALASAKAAIAKGAPKDAVIKRLQQAGIDTTGL